MKSDLDALREHFDEVWLVDAEFSQPAGEHPTVHCVVAHELYSARWVRWWRVDNPVGSPCPISTGARTLIVSYFATAEINAFRALGFPPPTQVLDLYAEFRCLTSGITIPDGYGLLGASTYFGLPCSEPVEKETMRELAIRGGPFAESEKQSLLDYCQSDVEALENLFEVMLPFIELPCAVLRGRYMLSVAAMEWRGIPIDTVVLHALHERRTELQAHLIQTVDTDFGVFEGDTFKADRWAKWVSARHIDWPRLPSGLLKLDDETFKEIGQRYPDVDRMRQLRRTLVQLRANKLEVGADGRNRTMLSPFASRTGRNQPSTNKFIFGAPSWMRSLIKPAPGMALAYLDYEQQEFGIAAALAGDTNMMEAYRSGEPYMEFARMAQAVPADATKQSHPHEREMFKGCALGVQYGMAENTMALRLGIHPLEARGLLDLHRRVFRTYWKWSDDVQDFAMLHGYLEATFGWKVHVVGDANPRSLRNFPLQANGAEMLRLACCLAHERGVCLCAPIHDALLIEAPSEQIDESVECCTEAMIEASAVVLEGFSLRVESKTIRNPERYRDPRGTAMWKLVTDFLEARPTQPVPSRDTYLSHTRTDVPSTLCIY